MLKVMWWPQKKDICVFSNSIDRDISQTYTFPISLGLGEVRVAITPGNNSALALIFLLYFRSRHQRLNV